MVKVNEMNSEDTKSNFIRILKGTGISMVATMIFLLIYSIFLTYTGLSENTIPGAIIIITAISILAGSIMSSLNIKKNGLVNGALVGLIYILFIYLISSIVSQKFSINAYSIGMIVASVVAGAIGGIIGVNRKK